MPYCNQYSKYAFCVYRGACFELVVEVKNEDNSIFDLTGYNPTATFKGRPNSSSPLITLTEGAGLVTDIPLGTITVTLTPDNTGSDLDSVLLAFWDLVIVNQNDATDIVPLITTSQVTLEDSVS